MKTYHLFRTPSGKFSPRTIDYCGTTYTVAATNLRQAMALAYKNGWTDEPGESVGIVAIYERGVGDLLWDDCTGHLGFRVGHLKGVRAMKKAASDHRAEHHLLGDGLSP